MRRSLHGRFLFVWLILLRFSAPDCCEAKPAAGVSGLLSIVPGLGQTANGDFPEGLAWFGSVLALFVMPSPITRQIGYDLWQYNMYDAYRDAGPSNRRVTRYNVAQNYIAAFNPLNIIDPIGAPIVGVGAMWGSRNGYAGLRNPSYIPYYAFVGLGEEGLFRGFLFPALSDWISTFPSAVVSSAMFSLFHITNGKEALAPAALSSRFVLGMLFCWQAHRNKYDLRKNIFAHAWYDVFVAPGSKGMIDGAMAGYRFEF